MPTNEELGNAGQHQNCATDGWAVTPSGMHGVLNDATSIYFADARLASAFVARWCVGAEIETARGVFPAPRGGSSAIAALSF